MNMQRKLGLVAMLAAVAVFGGCSDDDNTSAPAPTPITTTVPGSAGNSPADFNNAVTQLVNSANVDLLEPSDISAVAASTTATDETSDPAPVTL